MKYKNTEPPYTPHGFSTVWKWAVADKVWGRRRQSPRRVAVPVVPPDESLLAAPVPSLTWVGHATWLVRLAGRTLVTDPNWSTSLGPGITRNVPPGVPLERARPDIVLISHNHRDHLDAPTIDRLGPTPTYIVPAGLGAFFRRRGCAKVIELDWWADAVVDGVRVTFVPSQHWSQRGIADRNDTLWGGFVASAGGKSVYFAGDTAYFGGFRAIGERFPGIDAALLPIGAYDPEWFMRVQHMHPDDALRAFLDLGARLFCAMHWGTFKLTDEPLDEPPILLEQARAREQVPRDKVWIPAIGESRAL
jgi:L-ascorbate metabolism protein UlaG (beta-lactamase superfamily)